MDTHVHLFASPHLSNLAWMTPDAVLHRDCRLDEYAENNFSNVQLRGLVFVETDVKNNLSDLETGYEQAIQEYLWIERIIDGNLLDGEGVPRNDDLIKGIVPWAPMPNGAQELQRYVQALKSRSKGERAFTRVKGFRYLLQDKPPKTMMQPKFIQSLNWLSENGFVFDLGIDLRSGGLWQVEEFVQLVSHTSNVTYIVNHLTKPNFYIPLDQLQTDKEFLRWKSLMTLVSQNTENKFFIKLSGGFSELPLDLCNNVKECAIRILPWLQTLVELFGKSHIIWGSDWPVCTVNGGESAISKWLEITEFLIDKLGLNPTEVLYSNSLEAYNISE